MEETNEQPSLLNHAIKWAVILGAIGIVIVLLLYVVDYALMVQLKFLFAILIIDIGVAIYSGIVYRNSVGGYLSYGKAWQHITIVLVVSTILYTVFSAVLYFVVDTELPQKLVDAAIENQRAMMEGFGAPADQIDEAIDKAKESAKDQYTAFGMLKGTLGFSAFWAVIALILALFVRKNEPVEL